ncbi:MAG: DUF1214 domain-containing protein [Rhodobiaceae bacterium]|nr:DUF1214 domain-containing protein [Rhodobiaceae bacterium]MCC0016623.1 DUF1214 domain-containing protein [Rhodobiaceae bacterium]MCC0042274.1 DUF1214 domain-containing protein [Rhodobiaceae bacterium]
MLFFLQLIVVSLLALALGLWSAFHAVDRGIGFEAIKRGSWVAWAQAGLPDADPYTEATFARSGELPLVGGQSIAFSAASDDDGNALSGNCSYRIFGKAPPAQWWTLVVFDAKTRVTIDNPSHRPGFSSSEVIYRADGTFEVALSGEPQPGNWIPLPQATDLRIFLRFYDTPVALGDDFEGAELPRIVRGACR